MKKLFVITLLAPMALLARYSDECRAEILAIREKYAERTELIKQETEQETNTTKATIRNKNIALAQKCAAYEEKLAKHKDKCFLGRFCSFTPAKPAEYDLYAYCWHKLNAACYEKSDK